MPHPRSLLHLPALASPAIRQLVARTAAGGAPPPLSTRGTIALLCARPAPLARSAIEAGAALLGLRVSVYGPAEVAALGDAALAGARLSQAHPALVGAGFGPGVLAELAGASTVPVVNAGDGEGDPVGALADLALFGRWLGSPAGRRLTWVGDAGGLLNDLLVGGPAVGMSVAVAHPMGFAPDAEHLTWARERAAEAGAAVLVTTDLVEALDGASVVYVDEWPAEHAERFRPYAVQRHSLRDTRPNAVVLHRAPERRGAELSASFAEDLARLAVEQHRARIDAAAVILDAALRPDPLISVVG